MLAQAQLEAIRANAYDLVINGQEVGGGSIRIENKTHQKRMFCTVLFCSCQV